MPIYASPVHPLIIERIVGQFSLLHPVSPGLKADMCKHAFEIQLKENSFLLEEGMVSDGFYFVLKGIVRGFSSKRQRELTTWISEEGEFVSSISGMYGKVSKETIQAVEPCVLIGISNAVLLSWYDRFPEMNIIIRKVLESYYQDAQERSFIIRIGTAIEKYNYFAETRPRQINRVPLDCIASFLGMTTKTLERISNKKKRLPKDGTVQEVVRVLEHAIVSRELFKIKGLSVSRLSTELSIPVHTLSQVFSGYYKKHFSDFLNSYRINYVKQQLTKGTGWKLNKIEAIGLEAGFASRSTFFAAFRKLEGVTPAAYAAVME